MSKKELKSELKKRGFFGAQKWCNGYTVHGYPEQFEALRADGFLVKDICVAPDYNNRRKSDGSPAYIFLVESTP